ncbi:hypothetical protein J2X66_005929 [Pseudomonas sp. 3296]|jgi:hypothetical protein|uniref:hypothetical protein n=1 Tax=Pseudomonas sp. 3296 TaxID=2817753 RepID=UPI002858BDC6|nr:hypothetical protein [Pseudomonas sp. 3296]MDR6919024.1 hypothetical protein [Pseudomonas sp. 3296]
MEASIPFLTAQWLTLSVFVLGLIERLHTLLELYANTNSVPTKGRSVGINSLSVSTHKHKGISAVALAASYSFRPDCRTNRR